MWTIGLLFSSIFIFFIISSKFAVPITFASRVEIGAKKLKSTYDWAAKWKITSGLVFLIIFSSENGSKRSPHFIFKFFDIWLMLSRGDLHLTKPQSLMFLWF